MHLVVEPCEFYSSQNIKIINVWDRVIGYMTALMQQASPRMSSWASLQQADTQTAVNETESKMQKVNTQSSSLKVVRQTYLSSADAARSHIASLILKWADN